MSRVSNVQADLELNLLHEDEHVDELVLEVARGPAQTVQEVGGVRSLLRVGCHTFLIVVGEFIKLFVALPQSNITRGVLPCLYSYNGE